MRWFSHRARTWKDTVLKIKIKKKAKGFTLVATALAVLCWIFIAQAFFMMSSGTLSTVKAERVANQAEQNAALDVSRLKALDYDDLDSKGAHARKVIDGVGDGNWESEVTIDPEQPLNGGDDDAKLRIAHVKVYRTGDTTSRYSLDVPLTSQNKAANNGFEEVDFDSRILTFEPILYYSDMPHWNGGVTDSGLVKATGEIQISYAEHRGTQVNYNSKHGTISLGKIPSNDIDKAVTISGGYQSGTIANVSSDRKRLIEASLSYIREHLDDFKAKAFNAIPESSNAIKFIIISPDDKPMGSSHGGSQGGGH